MDLAVPVALVVVVELPTRIILFGVVALLGAVAVATLFVPSSASAVRLTTEAKVRAARIFFISMTFVCGFADVSVVVEQPKCQIILPDELRF